MRGYVTVEKSELKIIEYEIYNAYYCGVCKSIGRRYGQIPRIALSYDAAFLAVLLAALSDESDEPVKMRCIIHPMKKKLIISNEAVDYAGDVMLILAWHKILDDVHDKGKFYDKSARAVMKKVYRKLNNNQPALCRVTEDGLNELTQLERKNCLNLDEAAEAFSKIMERILSGYLKQCNRGIVSGVVQRQALEKIGYHLGKWIYVIDAIDDIKEDIESSAYNPLLCRFSYDSEVETAAEFKERIKESCRRSLLIYLAEMTKALDLLDIKKNRGIIENVAYMGLLRKTEEILYGNEKD